VSFSCPGCQASVEASLALPLLRCRACSRWLRRRVTTGETLAYDVEVLGDPATRRRVEVPWKDAESRRRMRRLLLLASAVTLGLVPLLYLLARLG